MTCTPLVGPDGQVLGIVCARGQRRPHCSVPGCGRTASALCDFRLRSGRSGKTCDARLCSAHGGSTSGAANVDYCPAHRKLAAAQDE